MGVHEQWFPGRLLEISPAECLELVAARAVGRISYCTDNGPVTVPVNHVLIGGDVVLRTASYSDLGQHLLRQPRVCYQVDDFDDDDKSGWSVLIQGRATVIDAADLPSGSERPAPWVEGTRTLHVKVRGDSVTGRRVVAPG